MTLPKASILYLYYLLFFVVWAAKEYLFATVPALGTQWLLLFVKLLVWVVPVVLYLLYVDRTDWTQALRLTTHLRRGLLWGLLFSAILAAGEIGLTYRAHGRLNLDLGIRWLTTPLFALPEEILFRGFFQQQLEKRIGFAKGHLIASLLFGAIHLPVGILNGYKLGAYIPILVVGYLLGFIYKRTGSLWAPWLVHATYNLLGHMRL